MNDIEILCAANNELKKTVSALLNDCTNIVTSFGAAENQSFVLNCLLRAAQRNISKQGRKNGNRYENPMKDFASYIFMLGGRLMYETLYENLPLPSPSSVGSYLHNNGPAIVEGEMRCDQLKKYLEERNLPMVVWISEDATRITGRLQYDPGTNQVVGLVLPLNENGLPKTFSFIASSAGTMEKHVTNNTVALLVCKFENFSLAPTILNFFKMQAYVIMAQPLALNTEPFCLQLYITINLTSLMLSNSIIL